MERKLVAKNEVSWISQYYKIPLNAVRQAKATAKNGTKTVSRRMIYAKLIEIGWLELRGKRYYNVGDGNKKIFYQFDFCITK